MYESVRRGRIEEERKTERAQMMKQCFIICALDSRCVSSPRLETVSSPRYLYLFSCVEK